jgi:hypothetical protein
MPSSFTAEVYDGTKNDLQSFALRCARGMTYTIHMRDMNFDIPPRLRVFPASLPEELRAAEAEVAALEAMSPEEVSVAAEEDYRRIVAARAEAAAEDEKVRVRYAVMRLKVETWEVPEALASLKKFMLEQLDESQRHDCGMAVWPEPTRISPQSWHFRALERARRNVAYLLGRISDESQMCEQSNAWITALYAALPTKAEEAEIELRSFGGGQ